MSSILPFVVVALILAAAAWAAMGAAAQPATESGGAGRDPWRERLEPLVQWGVRSARDVRRWLLAGVAAIGHWRRQRRDRRRADRAARRARRAEARSRPPVAEADPSPSPVAAVSSEPLERAPEGVMATALRVTPDVAVADTAGEDLPRRGPGLLVRIRSALGLVLLIAALGLALAVVLGAVGAAVGAAFDGFVN